MGDKAQNMNVIKVQIAPLDVPYIQGVDIVLIVPADWSEQQTKEFIKQNRKHDFNITSRYNVGMITHFYFGQNPTYLLDNEIKSDF